MLLPAWNNTYITLISKYQNKKFNVYIKQIKLGGLVIDRINLLSSIVIHMEIIN